MGRGRGLLIAAVAVVLLETVTGVVGVVLLGPVDIALYLLACAGATAILTVLAARLIGSRHRGDDDEGEGGGGPDPAPPWWPQFEQDFWRHVRDRERSPA